MNWQIPGWDVVTGGEPTPGVLSHVIPAPAKRALPMVKPMNSAMTFLVGKDGRVSDCKGPAANGPMPYPPCSLFERNVFEPSLDERGEPQVVRVQFRSVLTVDPVE